MMLCFGVNHTVASITQREHVAVPKDQLAQWLADLRRGDIHEVVILSTCNRTELYAEVAADDVETARQLFMQAIRQCSPEAAEIFSTVGYRHSEFAAMAHLFRVACSLDAMVVGEPQVLGQVKTAYEAACQHGAVGPHFHQIFQRAFRVAKRVREQTGLGERPVSIGSVAVNLATQLFGDITQCRALVLGTGEMGQQVVQCLRSAEVGSLALSGRTGERLNEIAHHYGAEVIPWADWPAALAGVDIVLCSTGAPHNVVTRERVEQALAHRDRRPLFLIDIAVPRNIETNCNQLPNVYLYDVDDLQAIANDNLAARRAIVETAESLVTEMATQAWRTLQSDSQAVVSMLHQKCEEIRRREVARTLQQLGAIDPAIASALDRCTGAIVAKMLHDPIVCVKDGEANAIPSEAPTESLATPIDWVRRLFRLA